MRANRSVSGVERAVRRGLWARGFRGYRVTARLPGKPDLAYPRQRVAVFVHGCFWHRCPRCVRRGLLPYPRANADFWRVKFSDNKRRDRRVAAALRALGWSVIVLWECAVRRDPEFAATRIASAVRARQRHVAAV